MAMNVSKEVVELIMLVRRAFTPLRDNAPFKNSQDLVGLDEKSGEEHRKNNKDLYIKNASRILDYFVFHATEIFLEQAQNYKEVKNIPDAAQYINFALTVNEQFVKENIIHAALYLSENRTPEFMDDETLYQKMLWQEWWQTRLKQITKKQQLPDAVFTLLLTEINRRLIATEKFLNDYAKRHPNVADTLAKHRQTYKEITHEASFCAAYAISGKGKLAVQAPEMKANPAPAEDHPFEIKREDHEEIEAIKKQLADIDIAEIKRFVREELPALTEKLMEHTTFINTITPDTPIEKLFEMDEELKLFHGQLEDYQQELTVFNNTDEEFVMGNVQIASLIESTQELQINYDGILSNIRMPEEKGDIVEFDVTAMAKRFTVDETTNIVVIGAGPTGLWGSLLIKLSNPNVNIQILERYNEFKRKQTLRLDLNEIVIPELHAKLLALAKERKLKKSSNHLFIPIKIFQQFLENEVKALSIPIHKNVEYAPVEQERNTKRFQLNLDQLRGIFPNAKMFIAADGSHSIVRKSLFGPDDVMLTTQAVQYLAEIKYSVVLNDNTRKLDYISQGYATEKLAGFRCDETVSLNKEKNTAAITLRFIIDKETFELLGDINFKEPLTNLNYMPVKLQNAANVWLRARQLMTDEKIIPNTAEVTKFPLLIYRSKQFTKRIDDIHIFLLGDGAFGVPYFRALNAGLHCATKLSELITSVFQKSVPVTKMAEQYEKSVEADYNAEQRLALTKDFGLELWKAFVKINHKVPLNLNHWDGQKQKFLESEHVLFIQTAHHPYKVSARNKAPLTPIEKRVMELTSELRGLTNDFIHLKADYLKFPDKAIKYFNENTLSLNEKNDSLHARILQALDVMMDEMQKAGVTDVHSLYLNYFLIQVTRYNGLFFQVSAAGKEDDIGNLLLQLENTMISHPLLSAVAQKSLTYRHIAGNTLAASIFRDPVRETVKGKMRYGYHDKIDQFIDHHSKSMSYDTPATHLSSTLSMFTPNFMKNNSQQRGNFWRLRDDNAHRIEEKNFLEAWAAVKAGEPLTQQQRQLFANGRYYRGHMPVTFRLPAALTEKDNFIHYHVGHAAELIQTGAGLVGFDLVNYHPTSVFYPRNTQPGMTTDCYPMLPVICISHNHYDHLDKNTLKEALHGMNPLIIVSEGDGALLKEWGFQHVVEFASWNDSIEITLSDWENKQKTLIIRSLPAKHTSHRSLTDCNISLFMGHILQEKGKNFVTIVTGDTAVLDEEHYQQLEDFLVAENLHIASACIASGPDRPRQQIESIHQSTADAIMVHARFNVINTRVIANRRKNDPEVKEEKEILLKDFATSGCNAISYRQGCYGPGTMSDADGTFTRILAVLASFGEKDLSFVYTDLQQQYAILSHLSKNSSCDTSQLSNYYFAIMDAFERAALLETIKQYIKVYATLKLEEKALFTANYLKEHICRHLYLPQAGSKIDPNNEAKEPFGFQYQRLIVNRDLSQQKTGEYESCLDKIIALCLSDEAFRRIFENFLSGGAMKETKLTKVLLLFYLEKTPFNYFSTAPKQKIVQQFLVKLRDDLSPLALRRELIVLRGQINQWKTFDESQRNEGGFETIMLVLIGLLDRHITQFDLVFKNDLIARQKIIKKADDKLLFSPSSLTKRLLQHSSTEKQSINSSSSKSASPSSNKLT